MALVFVTAVVVVAGWSTPAEAVGSLTTLSTPTLDPQPPIAGVPVTFSSTLRYEVTTGNLQPLAGQSVSFVDTFNGSITRICGGTTNASGVASCSYTYTSAAPQFHNVRAEFLGDPITYNSTSSGTVSFLVVTTPTAPPAPDAVPGDGQVTLSWTAPDNGNTAITGYTVGYKSPTDSDWTSVVPDPVNALSITIGSLTNGVSYQFVVKATNAVGDSPWSAATTAVPSTVPRSPRNVAAVGSNAAVTVSWDPPADTGGLDITGYTVAYKADILGTSWITASIGPTTTSLTISPLTNGIAYDMKVAAANSDGLGDYSAVVSATPSTTPATPATPVLTAGNTQMTVWWAVPDSGGSPITSYSVAWKGPSDTGWTLVTPTPATANMVLVTGLTNGVTYTFKVAAANANGTSPYSATASAAPTAPANVPSAPGTPTATKVSKTQVNLTWTDGPTNGAAITNHRIYVYTVTYNGTGKRSAPVYTFASSFETGASTTAATVGGLSSLTNYAFTVAAYNSVGWSSPSPYSNVTKG